MNVKRRLQRTVIRGQEGDDLLDEGAESAEYTISGNMPMSEFKEILKKVGGLGSVSLANLGVPLILHLQMKCGEQQLIL